MLVKYSSILILLTFAMACANPYSPSGGPKDTTPPQLDASTSMPNLQTNFSDREIQLTFNEWIQLDNAYGQLVVSPPLEYRPEVRARGKSLIFKFDERETLLDSVTYTINFGAAVKDNTEGNKVNDLRFVFSTGPEIDSLEYSGKVIDAFTAKPMEELPVLLFPVGEDSVVFHEKPFYYSTTDKNGIFNFRNLREGKFLILALKDENNNLKYDLPSEGIAFSNAPVLLPDTTRADPVLRFSLPEKYEPFTSVKAKDSIHLVIGFAGELHKEVDIRNLPKDSYFSERIRDSLHIWIRNHSLWPDSLIIAQDSDFDTIKIDSPSGNIGAFKISSSNISGGKIPPQLSLFTEMNQPILKIDTSRIVILDTAGQFLPLDCSINSSNKKRMIFKAPLKAGQLYVLKILPGGLFHWNGLASRDTIDFNFKIGKREDYGRLILNVSGFEKGEQYWLEVLDKNERAIYQTEVEGTAKSIIIDLDGQLPGQYSLRAVKDVNNNMRWDPGNYWKKRQPEKIYTIPLGELRANWELKLDVPITEGK